MSGSSDVLFHLSPSYQGYTLQMTFPSLGTQKEVHFFANEEAEEGATLDLYSQNGKVDEEDPLNCFKGRDVQGFKSILKVPVPEHLGVTQSLFVLDLQDQNGHYEELESIRHS